MPASHQGPTALEWTHISQPLCRSLSCGFQLPFPALSPIFNFQGSIVPKLGSDLVLSLGFLLPFVFSILINRPFLVPLSFQGVEPEGCRGGPGHGTHSPCPQSSVTAWHSILLSRMNLYRLWKHASEPSGHTSCGGQRIRGTGREHRKERKKNGSLWGNRLCSGSQPECFWSGFLLFVMFELVSSAPMLNSCPKN